MLCFFKKPFSFRYINSIIAVYPPILSAIIISTIFYPGAMSYDSLHALRGARSGVVDSMWPPMVSYVWQIVNIFSENPSAMHFVQVLILLLSIYFIITHTALASINAINLLLIYIFVPVILGNLVVIWKDVLMSSFLFLSFVFALKLRNNIQKKCAYSLSFVVAIFLGICSRHNAITAAVPILFYFVSIFSSGFYKKMSLRILFNFLCWILLTVILFFGKGFIDTYSLPSLTKMVSQTSKFISFTRTLDVAGASVCVGENLFKEINPQLTVDEIRNGYDPKHVNLSAVILAKVGIDPRIDQIWLNTFIHHPICAWYNKFHMTRFMLGANSGAQYLITKEEIDENEFGYKFEKSTLRDLTYEYIIAFSKIPFLRPYFILLLSVISFVFLTRSKKLTAELLTIFMSGLFYLGSLVLFGNAADARLPFYSTSCFFLVAAIGFLEYRKARRVN